MPDIRPFWAAVKNVEAGLQEDVYVVSVEDPCRGLVGGRVTQVGRRAAARLIVEKSVTLATPEEIEAHHAENQRKAAEARAADEMRAGRTTVILPATAARKKAR